MIVVLLHLLQFFTFDRSSSFKKRNMHRFQQTCVEIPTKEHICRLQQTCFKFYKIKSAKLLIGVAVLKKEVHVNSSLRRLTYTRRNRFRLVGSRFQLSLISHLFRIILKAFPPEVIVMSITGADRDAQGKAGAQSEEGGCRRARRGRRRGFDTTSYSSVT